MYHPRSFHNFVSTISRPTVELSRVNNVRKKIIRASSRPRAIYIFQIQLDIEEAKAYSNLA